MNAAWFGLIGVIVGGVISTVWSWLAVVRQELTDAMVAARLVDEDLVTQVAPSLDPDGRALRPDLALWSAHRISLAKVLGKEQWNAVAAVYRPRDGLETPPPTAAELQTARSALRPLVEGKRYVIPQRWRNMVGNG